MVRVISKNSKNTVFCVLDRAFNSVFYPIIFAVICIISGLGGRETYLPMISVLCALVLLSAIFSSDNKVFLVPMLMAYYSLGRDFEELEFNSTEKGYLQSFDVEAFKYVCLLGVIMAIALVIRLSLDGTIKKAFKKRGMFTIGIICLDIAFLLNGIFSAKYEPINILYGALFGAVLTLFYFILLAMLDSSNDSITYACKTLVCASYVALFQTAIVSWGFYKNGLLFFTEEYLNHNLIRRPVLAWGVPTIIGAVIVLGIPAAMYLAKKCKYSVISYISAVLFLFGALLINSRSAMLFGAIFFVISLVFTCVGGKNKWFNRIFTLLMLTLGTGLVLYIFKEILPFGEAIKLLRFDQIKNDARIPLFKNAIDDFKSAPIFGIGINDGAFSSDLTMNNIYSMMYHNVFLQFLGAMGIVGIIAFFVHLKHLGELTVRRFTLNKLMLLLVPFMILAMSLFDNFFFYPNFQITYALFLVLAEIDFENTRRARLLSHKRIDAGRKPRVLFTYVEAGKGHIIPEGAVERSFREKYGEAVEIIHSDFYNETGDPKLKKTETLFVRTVKNQSKNFVAGALCRIGTWLCGDALSLSWTMACTPSGIQSKKRAVKHLKELDADVLFTTHWSTAYYAAGMKNPPYTVLLCPDPYTNGMFNVDVNCFLLPTEVGKKQADRRRFYAGGNVIAVDPIIRQSARDLLGKRSELRKKYGICESSFTVVLLDGGYGMAKLESTVEHLLKSKEDITIIAICGTNDELKMRLDTLDTPNNIKLIPLGYTNNILEYIALSDLFCGKAGANALAESAYFGVPIMVTTCATYIERHTKNYYVKKVGGALYIPSSRRAAKYISHFAGGRKAIDKYKTRISKLEGVSGEDSVADIIYRAAIQK